MRARVLILPALLSLAPAAWPVDAEGCRDLPILQRIPGCEIRECRARDYDEAELQSGPVDRSGDYAGSMFYNELPGFTARRGTTWVQLVSEPFDALTGYTVTMVRANEVSGAPGTRPGPRPSPR